MKCSDCCQQLMFVSPLSPRCKVVKCLSVSLTEVDSSQLRRQLCGGSQAAIERMIHFGRELQAMSEQLRRECGKNTANKKMLKVNLFSLEKL